MLGKAEQVSPGRAKNAALHTERLAVFLCSARLTCSALGPVERWSWSRLEPQSGTIGTPVPTRVDRSSESAKPGKFIP
jgi:hypothetical protein